jgi:hypothetical protein
VHISCRPVGRLCGKHFHIIKGSADQVRPSHAEVVQGARNALATLLQDVGGDPDGGKLVMPEQVRYGADVGAAVEQVRRKGVATVWALMGFVGLARRLLP